MVGAALAPPNRVAASSAPISSVMMFNGRSKYLFWKKKDGAPKAKIGVAMSIEHRWFARYAVAVGAVAVAFLLRQGIMWLGWGDLPPFITFYPAIMLAALLSGLGPGLLATATTALLVHFYILPQLGFFGIARLRSATGLVLFIGNGVSMSVIAALYRHTRSRLEEMVAARTAALGRANEQLAQEI